MERVHVCEITFFRIVGEESTLLSLYLLDDPLYLVLTCPRHTFSMFSLNHRKLVLLVEDLAGVSFLLGTVSLIPADTFRYVLLLSILFSLLFPL